jgi:hypothetical protein
MIPQPGQRRQKNLQFWRLEVQWTTDLVPGEVYLPVLQIDREWASCGLSLIIRTRTPWPNNTIQLGVGASTCELSGGCKHSTCSICLCAMAGFQAFWRMCYFRNAHLEETLAISHSMSLGVHFPLTAFHLIKSPVTLVMWGSLPYTCFRATEQVSEWQRAWSRPVTPSHSTTSRFRDRGATFIGIYARIYLQGTAVVG